ncbi:hypothetical protein [Streptomyces venezuelae]
MLDVTYEAVDHLAPGQLVNVDEGRGRIRVELDRHAPLQAVVQKLNVEVDQLLATGHWFQLWRDEIISRATPRTSLRINYLLHRIIGGTTVAIEDRGLIDFHADPALDTAEFAASVNVAVKNLLDGGQWFQLYDGEIIDNSPEPNKV